MNTTQKMSKPQYMIYLLSKHQYFQDKDVDPPTPAQIKQVMTDWGCDYKELEKCIRRMLRFPEKFHSPMGVFKWRDGVFDESGKCILAAPSKKERAPSEQRYDVPHTEEALIWLEGYPARETLLSDIAYTMQRYGVYPGADPLGKALGVALLVQEWRLQTDANYRNHYDNYLRRGAV